MKPEPRLQISAYKASSSPTELSLPNPYLTVYDILLVSVAITLNHRRTILLHINTLVSGIHTSHTLCRIAQAYQCFHIQFMNTKGTQLHNFNFITCSKTEI